MSNTSLRPFTAVEHNWEETTIYGCDNNAMCHFNIHDFGDVTEENQEEISMIMDTWVQRILNLLNGDYHDK